MSITETEKAERIAKSTDKYLRRTKEQQRVRELLSEGRKVFLENEMKLARDKIGEFDVALGFRGDPMSGAVVVSYALCSPRDTFSYKVARGYLGARSCEWPPQLYRFVLEGEPEILSDTKRLAKLATLKIKEEILRRNVMVPRSLERVVE